MNAHVSPLRVRLGRSLLWAQLPLKFLVVHAHRHALLALRRVRGGRPRLLLVGSSKLSTEYVTEAGRVLAREFDADIWLATRGDDVARDHRTFRTTGLTRSAWLWWDCALFADHVPLFYSRSVPSVEISHGLVRSRNVREGSYRYDRGRALRLGKPVYSLLIDASEHEREFGERLIPELAGRIRVVGDIRTDRMLARASAIGLERRHLVMMSTWGEHSLMTRHGSDALSALDQLVSRREWTATVTTHPRLWKQTDLRWQALLAELASRPGVEVLEPGADWTDALAAASVCVSDHTSLVGAYALLGRPIVLAPIPPGLLASGTLTELLYQCCPIVQDWCELESVLEAALAAGLPSLAREFASSFVSYPGEAAARLCACVAELVPELVSTGSRNSDSSSVG